MKGELKTCNYSPTAPGHWANMHGNEACGLNKQSPINIVTEDLKYKEHLGKFVMSGYDKAQGELFLHNNGHTGKPTQNRESYVSITFLFSKIFGLVTYYNSSKNSLKPATAMVTKITISKRKQLGLCSTPSSRSIVVCSSWMLKIARFLLLLFASLVLIAARWLEFRISTKETRVPSFRTLNSSVQSALLQLNQLYV